MSVEKVKKRDEQREEGVELELRVKDSSCFFVAASDQLGCRVELVDMIMRSDGKIIEFFSFEGAESEEISAIAEEAKAIEDYWLVRESDDGYLYKFVLDGPCVMVTLADYGVFARSVVAQEGQGRVIANMPPHVDVRRVVERFKQFHPDSTVVAQRENNESGHIGWHVEPNPLVDLTPRQVEVLQSAYEKGYFKWPRENTAEECANSLNISQPTFNQHVRSGQQRMFERIFDSWTGA